MTQFLAVKREDYPSISWVSKWNLHSVFQPKLYKPSTLNIDFILWHTKLIVCAENVKSWFKSWVHFSGYRYFFLNIKRAIAVSK